MAQSSTGKRLYNAAQSTTYLRPLIELCPNWIVTLVAGNDLATFANGPEVAPDYRDASKSELASVPPPRHIAAIMDGNRRYGKEKFGNALKGHWAGGDTLGFFTDW